MFRMYRVQKRYIGTYEIFLNLWVHNDTKNKKEKKTHGSLWGNGEETTHYFENWYSQGKESSICLALPVLMMPMGNQMFGEGDLSLRKYFSW